MIYETPTINVQDPGVIQFENANEGRSYPFDDNTQLVDNDGKTLDENTIVDLHLVVPTGLDAYLASVRLSDALVSVCLKLFSGTVFKSALSVTVNRSEFEPYMPYRLEKLTGFEDVGGIISFGNIGKENPNASYRFSDCRVKVVDSAVSRYVPAVLRKITDDRTGESVSGNVKIAFSDYVDTNLTSDGEVQLSLKDGAADILASSCYKNRPINRCGATPITSINGVAPDVQDRIVLWFH